MTPGLGTISASQTPHLPTTRMSTYQELVKAVAKALKPRDTLVLKLSKNHWELVQDLDDCSRYCADNRIILMKDK